MIVTRVKPMATNLFDFAWCGNDRTIPWSQYIAQLAALARPEVWGTDNAILVSYLNQTFENLAVAVNHGQASLETYFPTTSHDHRCCFNTGLFTKYDEPIYAYFEKNELPAAQKWYLKGFKTANASELVAFRTLPARMVYLSDPAEFVFDPSLPWRLNCQHILGPENLVRLPAALQQTTDRELVLQLFNGAVQSTRRQLTANYNLAVPHSFHGQIQLLVPIRFGNKVMPDLVLSLSREDQCYVGHTCLTPEMAYRDARVIATPTAPWLVAVKGGDEANK